MTKVQLLLAAAALNAVACASNPDTTANAAAEGPSPDDANVCPEAASWRIGACIEGPGLSVPDLEKHLTVVGPATATDESCMLGEGAWTFHDSRWQAHQVTEAANRWELRDDDGNTWRMQVELPGMASSVLADGQAIDVRAHLETFGAGGYMGWLEVESDGAVVAAVGQNEAPPSLQVTAGEVLCTDSCTGDEVSISVATDAGTASLGSWETAQVGDMTVANAYWRIHGGVGCADGYPPKAVGAYRQP